jgi:hypothetical protein
MDKEVFALPALTVIARGPEAMWQCGNVTRAVGAGP